MVRRAWSLRPLCIDRAISMSCHCMPQYLLRLVSDVSFLERHLIELGHSLCSSPVSIGRSRDCTILYVLEEQTHVIFG
uniref:Uncharacterized protein n=1 Tax=Arundo donax TaxID=35708 RepID=A0A0A8Y7S0_ARUDO